MAWRRGRRSWYLRRLAWLLQMRNDAGWTFALEPPAEELLARLRRLGHPYCVATRDSGDVQDRTVSASLDAVYALQEDDRD